MIRLKRVRARVFDHKRQRRDGYRNIRYFDALLYVGVRSLGRYRLHYRRIARYKFLKTCLNAVLVYYRYRRNDLCHRAVNGLSGHPYRLRDAQRKLVSRLDRLVLLERTALKPYRGTVFRIYREQICSVAVIKRRRLYRRELFLRPENARKRAARYQKNNSDYDRDRNYAYYYRLDERTMAARARSAALKAVIVVIVAVIEVVVVYRVGVFYLFGLLKRMLRILGRAAVDIVVLLNGRIA